MHTATDNAPEVDASLYQIESAEHARLARSRLFDLIDGEPESSRGLRKAAASYRQARSAIASRDAREIMKIA